MTDISCLYFDISKVSSLIFVSFFLKLCFHNIPCNFREYRTILIIPHPHRQLQLTFFHKKNLPDLYIIVQPRRFILYLMRSADNHLQQLANCALLLLIPLTTDNHILRLAKSNICTLASENISVTDEKVSIVADF